MLSCKISQFLLSNKLYLAVLIMYQYLLYSLGTKQLERSLLHLARPIFHSLSRSLYKYMINVFITGVHFNKNLNLKVKVSSLGTYL